ncbi:MAG: HAMP domain-containing protein [Candidatus Omnitrophica bacterium]|nr:HAMP domain-containing protein [Candidatus Omnitrophota bacterium]
MQVDFKKEVQEWKDILLRGHNQEDLKKYKGLFDVQHDLVQRSIEKLMNGPYKLTSAENINRLERFVIEYDDLQRAYNEALKIYTEGTGGHFKEADSSIRGKDRYPTDLLDEIVDTSVYQTQQVLRNTRKQRMLKVKIISVCLVFLSIISIVPVMLLSRSILLSIQTLTKMTNEIKKGNMDVAVVVKSNDEISDFAGLFNSMASRLKVLIQQEKEFAVADAQIRIEKQKVDELNALNKQLEASEQQLRTSQDRLKEINTGLEQKVKERTKELEDEKNKLEIKIQERTQEITDKIKELEKVNKSMRGRELRIIEMKREVNELCKELGRPEPYNKK